jgi:hypothetical protein
MSDTPDYYEVLGVEPGCGPQVVKKAYKRLAMQWHPGAAHRWPGTGDSAQQAVLGLEFAAVCGSSDGCAHSFSEIGAPQTDLRMCMIMRR